MIETMKAALEKIYQRGLEAVDPGPAVTRALESQNRDWQQYRKILVVGAGKAGVPMARSVEDLLGDRVEDGAIVVKEGHGGALDRIQVFEASHPEPDERGMGATRTITEMLSRQSGPEDLVLVLLSGGGSALLPLPVSEISLTDKQETTRVLLKCGASIQEINAIRKHLSQVKGGRFLDFTGGAQVLSLVLSDVVGDDFASIASGPTSPDPTTFADCIHIIQKYEIAGLLPESVRQYLQRGAGEGADAPPETPKDTDPRFENVRQVLVGSNIQALQAAAREAESLGYRPLITSSSIYGNTADVALVHVALAREILASGNPLEPPCCIISGGETTVQVTGSGTGGRNQEFALWCAHEIQDWSRSPLLFASLGSDGTDGPTDAAGAFASWKTVHKARERGLSLRDFLSRNDSYHLFKETGDLIITGPTLTNVMDLRFVLVGQPG